MIQFVKKCLQRVAHICDVFASALLGAYMNGLSLAESARIAVDYTHGCIVRTKEAGTDLRYGVDFEHGIPDLLRQTGII